jgi:hypothetical protein
VPWCSLWRGCTCCGACASSSGRDTASSRPPPSCCPETCTATTEEPALRLLLLLLRLPRHLLLLLRHPRLSRTSISTIVEMRKPGDIRSRNFGWKLYEMHLLDTCKLMHIFYKIITKFSDYYLHLYFMEIIPNWHFIQYLPVNTTLTLFRQRRKVTAQQTAPTPRFGGKNQLQLNHFSGISCFHSSLYSYIDWSVNVFTNGLGHRREE